MNVQEHITIEQLYSLSTKNIKIIFANCHQVTISGKQRNIQLLFQCCKFREFSYLRVRDFTENIQEKSRLKRIPDWLEWDSRSADIRRKVKMFHSRCIKDALRDPFTLARTSNDRGYTLRHAWTREGSINDRPVKRTASKHDRAVILRGFWKLRLHRKKSIKER